MSLISPMRPIGPMRLMRPSLTGGLGWVCLLFFILSLPSLAQTPIIGGHVYGGGNQGKVGGNTSVKITNGDIDRVFGGARMADVGGHAYLNITNRENTTILINQAYGGNDIAGTIGTSSEKPYVDILTGAATDAAVDSLNNADVYSTYNAFIHLGGNTSPIDSIGEDKHKTTVNAQLIGSLYAGGNGDFSYTDDSGNPLMEDGLYVIKEGNNIIAKSESPFSQPELAKTYLEIKGGSAGQVFGGGNNATITEQTVIHYDNPTQVVNSIKRDGVEILTVPEREAKMGYNPGYTYMSSDAFQVGNFFGGNNKADMAIRPVWDLRFGKIRNLYSGGNKGRMTYPNGLLLNIENVSYAAVPEGKLTKGEVYFTSNTGDGRFFAKGDEPSTGSNYFTTLKIDNIYGGCRMADVRPLKPDGTDVTEVDAPEGYFFPRNLAARVLINGGDVNNVYGGNDIRGKVYFGNAVGITSSIRGNVYGGGNGAYPYTDSESMSNDVIYGDLYYETGGYSNSVDAMNGTRPDAEQVSILVRGKDEDHPTIIGGAIFCGGNCATLETEPAHENLEKYPLVELKIGSYVFADNVYLGNNGEEMVDTTILKHYADDEFSSLDLTDASVFANYMQGAAMNIIPTLTFESTARGDRYNYEPYSSYIGSFFCGGNVGSMTYPGKNSMMFNTPITIYNKVVGGCNNASVPALYTGDGNTQLCTFYDGGVLGDKDTEWAGDGLYREGKSSTGKILDRLELNFNGVRIEPKRLNNLGQLEWNTAKFVHYAAVENGTTLTAGEKYYTSDSGAGELTAVGDEVANGSNYFEHIDEFQNCGSEGTDAGRRLLGGNVYGGCYNSGHVNGNVIININEDLVDKNLLFSSGTGKPNVDYVGQRDDLNAIAMAVFGAGMGEATEVWGSTTVNHNKGYAFQIYGGGEQGAVGKGVTKSRTVKDKENKDVLEYYQEYTYDSKFSSTVNLNGTKTILSSEGTDSEIPETEYIYGGGNEGDVAGNTLVNLGNGRIYDAFGGSSDADILGHSEVFIGRQPDGDGYKAGFPWVRDVVYGGNDFGGTIYGEYDDDVDVTERIDNYASKKSMLHSHEDDEKIEEMLKSSSYVRFIQGRVDTIYGGGYGFYDYSLHMYEDDEGNPAEKPYQKSAFVNIQPEFNGNNLINCVFGGGTGYPHYRSGDKSQDRSYVLIDIPKNGGIDVENFRQMKVFGAGSYNGMGMRYTPKQTLTPGFELDSVSAIVDLLQGKISNVYGGSYNEGITRRTVVNVPEGSTIWMYSNEPDEDADKTKHIKQNGNIFGGAYGTQILPPCDVYESNVNFRSSEAVVNGSIFGGNNNERRTLHARVNIYAPVHTKKGSSYTGTVYGAGQGKDTWSEYTEVNLYEGANVYEVYGGGMMGHVLNAESTQKYMELYKSGPSDQIKTDDPYWKTHYVDLTAGGATQTTAEKRWADDWEDAWTLGDYYVPGKSNGETAGTAFSTYATNDTTNLKFISERAELDDKTAALLHGKKYNTNVIVHQGATVAGYAYGGGYGKSATGPSDPNYLSGDVYGNTYITVLGGTVMKDVYAAGRAGGMDNLFGADGFTAHSNAYIKGGTVRNVYGGGYEGHVGHHVGNITEDFSGDRLAEAHVVIGTDDNLNPKASTDPEYDPDYFFHNAIPAITRNVYGGGEGGSVYGTSKVTLRNGYIGYRYKGYLAVPNGTKLTEKATYYTSDTGEGKFTANGEETSNGSNYYKLTYDEELDDQKPGDLDLSGNIFGGGYVINSYVDNTNINMYGGTVRGSLYGGGEIGPIGRGTVRYAKTAPYNSRGLLNGNARIYKAGTTQVNMYNGHVLRNVFGGGRGKDSWGGDGTMYMDDDLVATLDMDCKGYIFGQTRVNVFGGEVGTDEGMAYGYGNVFGGCDEGSVYSALQGDIYFTQAEIDAATEGDPAYGKTTSDVKTAGAFLIGLKSGKRYDGSTEGYYFESADGTNYLKQADGSTNIFTEDCKVVVEPHTRAKEGITIPNGGGTYNAGEYVPTSDLNKLKSKTEDNAYWLKLDTAGIIIHNAVFAGGNIAAGSSSMYANAITVYGNATASIHDVYNRDLITIGTGHTGGLYGDGNLTFVDGYRELNITNYGTDYYHIASQLPYDDYKVLPSREKAYYELKYKVKDGYVLTDNEGTTYKAGSTLPEDEIIVLFAGTDKIGSDGKPSSTYWQENGVVSVYAGRIMNTIQRADFCGVFGSRMVMKGAQDRVPETADYTNYTINRVREVSLNKKETQAGDPATIIESGKEVANPNHTHGNYFGIYSNVNFLGALTSDVKFSDERTTNADLENYPDLEAKGETFYAWKEAHKDDKTRNNGTCHNHLALASGVYLELTSEKSSGKDLYEKDWGPITGVIELDLINVQTGIGGGFVYARNEHGKPGSGVENPTLTALNDGAASKWQYKYDNTFNNWEENDANKEEWQTSGNFIHSSQTIIDDCYNVGSRYKGKYGNKDHGGTSAGVPAHYWYISGSVYVYDQYISAYTGSPNAYSETVEIPITINAASHGTMTLMDVQPNLHAYYSSYTDATHNTPLTEGKKLVINDVTYQLNDPISYWDWNKLPAAEKLLFVKDTYVTVAGCKIGSDTIYAGTVMLPETYNTYKTKATTSTVMSNGKEVTFDDIFHSSNNISHDTGYLLTYNVTNPKVWNTWYTKIISSTREKQQTDADGFEDGPTYHPTTTGLYGQQSYDVQAIISKFDYDKYNGYDDDTDGLYTGAKDVYGLKQMYPSISSRDDQATFVPAYVVTKEYTSTSEHYYSGAPVDREISGYTAPAYVSTATIQLSATEYIYVNELMTESQKTTYYNRFKDGTDAEKAIAKDIDDLVVPAYYCTKKGLYGGSYYETDKNYRGLEAYSAMSPADREHFTFNYDALDLLIDPDYGGHAGKKYQYDNKSYNFDISTASEETKRNMIYSLATPIDYTATYKGDDLSLSSNISLTRNGTLTTTNTVKEGDELFSTVYEKLPNEQHHYAPITVNEAGDYYVVKESFVHGEKPYAVGTTIDSSTLSSLSETEQKYYIDTLTFVADDVVLDASSNPIPYYYCRESYKVNENGEGQPVTLKGETTPTYTSGNTVPVGTLIDATCYSALPNKQKNFVIHGESPMETSTLYVARDANIHDLSSEKIITVIYKYDYEESDQDGTHITPVSERHVLNIHINFKSGVPTVEDINPPSTVLPGTSIYMRVPNVTPGAYEVTGGGWEVFATESNAESHINGMDYTPSIDSLYWYQDGYYLAYYAKTYLGKTYSNHVPISVANYHDLKKVMDDKKYHLHVDYDRSKLKRDSKIYINDYSGEKDGIDLLKDFYDLSLVGESGGGYTVTDGVITNVTSPGNTSLADHAVMNISETEVTNKFDDKKYKKGVKATENLEFIFRTDIDHTGKAWTPIANDTDDPCFKGNIHGDGHTVSGLSNSLIYNLCGDVYNLGVTGSFTSAGVVDTGTGYVESCWINTTGTPNPSVYAVFGNPSATDKPLQIVNSYYQGREGTNYKTTGADHGLAKAMPNKAFYNGEVAYDLNNFYLYKRFCDKSGDGEFGANPVYYNYWLPGNAELQESRYADNKALCSSGYNKIQYVEDRFEDGDFRYAAGEIPTSQDERYYLDTEDNNKEYWFPIWPDDYLFFGQALNYGYVEGISHQNVPTAVKRTNGRIDRTESGNRVYRAPAYFRDSNMSMAHFNSYAVFAQSNNKVKPAYADTIAYRNMTAIDFTGYNDMYTPDGAEKAYEKGFQGSKFFPPLLDDEGISEFQNIDLTRNLLVYTDTPGAGTAAGQTGTTVSAYLLDPEYTETETAPVTSDYTDTKRYHTVDYVDPATIHGHWVEKSGGDYLATTDHLLVDKQDFNAPVSYTFDSDKRMWYQRVPDKFVTPVWSGEPAVRSTKGWDGVSLPFTAELVTTDTKGEITHFYSGSDDSKNGTSSKIGHEYWLREFTGIKEEGEPVVATATFSYPTTTDGSETMSKKEVKNTFLWDYYYLAAFGHNHKDLNEDTYQTYYKSKREYQPYPLVTKATPYLIGFPGVTYYEFDLSGEFYANTTADPNHPSKLNKQTITFASQTGTTIGVSDDEMTGVTIKDSGNKPYNFRPSYLNEDMDAGTDAWAPYEDGSKYEKIPGSGDATHVDAFRPYFVFTGTRSAPAPRYIFFSNDNDGTMEPDEDMYGREKGNLYIYAKDRNIYTTSYLKDAVTIRIVNATGAALNSYTLTPGKTVITPVTAPGTYIVNKKKLYIR